MFRTRTPIFSTLLLLLFALSACRLPRLPSLAATPTPMGGAVEDFAGKLMLALINRDYAQLQPMLGEPFVMAGWQSEGSELPAGVALAQLRNTYLVQPQITFNTSQNLTDLLGGTNPLQLWGPDVNAVKALYVTGLGNTGKSEAILVIAQRLDKTPYWHGMLVAPAGFLAQLPVPPATAAPSAVQPTTVKWLQILQNVNVRGGPGKEYPALSFAAQGAVIEVFGVSADGQWWNVLCPDNSVGNCWDPNLTRPSAGPQPPTATPLPATATPLPTAVPPTQPVRIQFQPGATAATVRGMVSAQQWVSYLLRANAGQELTAQVQSAGNQVNFAITGVDDGQPYKRLVNEERLFAFLLPRTQDYRIDVAVPAGTVAYELQVQVVTPSGPAPEPAPERINFASGATSATVAGNLAAPNRKQYVLRANAGQEMMVDLQSPGNVVNFAITGVDDGQPYKRLENEDRFFSFTLPTSQDYLITLATPEGSPDYLLTVTIVTPAAPPPANPPVRVEFAPGANSVSLSGTISAGAGQGYLLRASAGQTMNAYIVSPNGDVALEIRGMTDGVVYQRSAVGPPSVSFVLPLDQDYLVSAVALGGDTSYTLEIVIQ
jgi:hypothetical protein